MSDPPKPPSYWFREDPEEMAKHRKEIAFREQAHKAYELQRQQQEKGKCVNSSPA